MADPRILFVADDKYANHLRNAIASVHVSVPSMQVMVHLINWEAEERERLEWNFKCIVIGHEIHNHIGEGQSKAYAANRRASVIARLLAGAEGPLIYLDADSCVRGPLTAMLKLLKTNDLVAHHRNGKEHTRLAVGVLGWAQTEQAAAAAADWAARVSPEQLKWFAEQRMLWRTIQSGLPLKVGKLPRGYIDWDFRSKSPIWAAKGSRKELAAYRQECQKFRETYEEGKPWEGQSS